MVIPISNLIRVNDLVGRAFGDENRPFADDIYRFIQKFGADIDSGHAIRSGVFTQEAVDNIRNKCWVYITVLYVHLKESALRDIRTGAMGGDPLDQAREVCVGIPIHFLRALDVEVTEENIGEVLREVALREDDQQFDHIRQQYAD